MNRVKQDLVNMKAFSSWSGGKESCLALYKAIRQGFEITCLLNLIDWQGMSRSHGLRAELLKAQAESMGIPIVQRKTSWGEYESVFKKAVDDLEVDGGVFGDIDVREHREWVERVCSEVGVESYLPLWGMGRREVANEFLGEGFEAIIIATRANILDESYIGCTLDEALIEDLSQNNIDVCGEGGEYHTLVLDGPIFKNRIDILEGEKILRGDKWFFDIKDYRISEKQLDTT